MAIDINKDISYQLSINVLKALGGDTSKDFQSVEEVWDEINKIYDNAGDRLDIEALIMDIRNNGLYEFYPNENADAYAPVRVNVNVPQKYTEEYVEQLGREAFNEGKIEGEEIGYQKGFAEGSDDGYQDGYSEGLDDGAEEQKSLMVEATIRGNGVYEREDGYRKVTVDVTIPTFETEQLSVELTENGDYNYTPSKDGYDSVSVSVNVPTSEPADLRDLSVEIKENKEYEFLPTDYDGWKKVNLTVSVPTGGGGDSGKPKIYNGFRFSAEMDKQFLSAIDFSQYDWSSVYDLENFFSVSNNDGYYFTDNQFDNFIEHFNGKITTMKSMFTTSPYKSLKTIPNLGRLTNDSINLSYAFSEESSLSDASNLAFWNTSKVVSTANMFYRCSKLPSVPLFDTSNVTNMNSMFYGCGLLTSVPLFDTSNVTDMRDMFNGCTKLESVPLFDTSNVTDMTNMFATCSLTTIPQFDTRNVTSIQYLFQNTTSITSIPLLDCGNVLTFGSLFGDYTNCDKLTDLGGFKDLGKVPTVSISTVSFLNKMPNLTHESLMNVINNLYNRKSFQGSTKTLKFGTTHLAKLSDEEKAIATNKGYTLT